MWSDRDAQLVYGVDGRLYKYKATQPISPIHCMVCANRTCHVLFSIYCKWTMDLTQDFQGIWADAQSVHLSKLSNSQRAKIKSITTQSELLAETRGLKEKYDKAGISRLLSRINPFIAQLNAFSQVVQTFVQSDRITALVWVRSPSFFRYILLFRDSILVSPQISTKLIYLLVYG